MIQQIEISKFNKEFGVFLVINTTECESWAVNGDRPLIQTVNSAEDFMNLGLEVSTSGKPYTDLKIGECVRDIDYGGDYEGVYVMRVG